jgi:UDP-N-acetylglucosamine 2-epimerase (non-hydrolysing)
MCGNWIYLSRSGKGVPVKALHIVGARPNFMKVAPIMREMAKYPHEFEQLLVHTGQHYDDNMSKVFFEDLELPQPDIYLGVGSGSHAQQTARIMLAFEPVLLEHRPDWVIVVGDVNSTVACALTAAKLGVKVAHVEAGLRSFDRTMPEEYNRMLTDHIADLLFTTEPSANVNLRREGIPEEKVHFVGNVMIDTLLRHKERALAVDVLGEYGLQPQGFALLTLHPRRMWTCQRCWLGSWMRWRRFRHGCPSSSLPILGRWSGYRSLALRES